MTRPPAPSPLRRSPVPRATWPLIVAALAIAVTAMLWSRERDVQQRQLRLVFDAGLRQTATRIEQRLAGDEQMLRGLRGLFDASDEVTRDDLSNYVDALLEGAEVVGPRVIAYAPWQDGAAPVVYAAPEAGWSRAVIGVDPWSDLRQRAAMERARDSGGIAVVARSVLLSSQHDSAEPGFLMFLPIYAQGVQHDTVDARRDALRGWVIGSYAVGDLMASLYGEAPARLEFRLYDGTTLGPHTLVYPHGADESPPPPSRFAAQEYIAHAGQTWTLAVRSLPGFDRRHGSDEATIIAVAGSGLALLLGLLTWQLVTGRERAHAVAQEMTRQLRESAGRYRGIVETANEGIWTVDARSRTTFTNPKMQELLGLDGSALLGRSPAEFIVADGGDEAAAPAAGPAASGDDRGGASRDDRRGAVDEPWPGDAQPREFRLRRGDGSDLWVAVSTSRVTDAAGRGAGVLAMVADVTERKRAEAGREALELQLRQSQKMEAIGTLAGGIAHDFNNILAAILGNVAMTRDDLGADHPAAARLDQVARAAARARSLVQQIVAFSRQQPQRLTPQPLQPLIDETVALLRPTLTSRVELQTCIAERPLRVGADATQLQQVLMNLCTNASHALPDGRGRIVVGADAVTIDADDATRLGLEAGSRHAHVWVRDNGSGMDDATRLRVFEPFFTTKPVGRGTGLGLAVAHGIVASHRGAIAVDSAPGLGSTFHVYLPLLDAEVDAGAASSAGAAGAPRGRGQHVLYVDDDPVMGVMVQALLERAGWRVSCLGDPRQALTTALDDAAGIDVVVTDYNMPELSGLDLAREILRRRPAMPLLMTSGYVSETLRDDAAEVGVAVVLQKEYTLEQLADALHGVLAER